MIKNQTTQQAGASFNISSNGTIGGNGSTGGNFTVGGNSSTIGNSSGSGIFTLSGNGSAGGNFVVGGNQVVDANAGTLANGLVFGASTSSEGLASKRTSGGNQAGLDFYTASTNRLAITNGGKVGIGTTAPATALEVNGTVTAASINPPATGTSNMLPVAYGLCYSGSTILTNPSTTSYSITHTAGSGVYTITFASASGLSGVNSGNLPVTVSLYGAAAGLITWNGGTGILTVNTFAASSGSIVAADQGFSFAVYKP